MAVPALFGITVILINKAFQPVQTISRGLSLLREGDFSTTLVKSGIPEADKIVEVYNGMISRLREERLTVREKNQFLDLLIESSPLGIVMVDFDEKIQEINPAAFRYLGIHPGEYRGISLCDLDTPLVGDLSALEFGERRKSGVAGSQQFTIRKLFFMDQGFRHPFYLIEEVADEIRQAEKSAYRKLIRMMAHEVNNTIGAVNSILSTVLDNGGNSLIAEDQDEVVQMLGVAVQRNYRLNRFMQNFADVVKLPLPEKESYELNTSLNNVVLSLNSTFTERNIKIEKNFQQDQLLVVADQGQMEQVFMNILKNSAESIVNHGTIQITTEGDPLRISIRDDGAGLSPESVDRLFTPFFSTKPDGQGIGLTLVREILENHGFQYKLHNGEGRGAEFEIWVERS
ncbi:MAG TPA: hypothetical protein DC042_13340 [Bacteroidales bacterium]|nr:hypothetical protein [Bacteroidales bacterium]